jgi:hypothetical protein
MGFGVLAILPSMEPESILQWFGHGRILLWSTPAREAAKKTRLLGIRDLITR